MTPGADQIDSIPWPRPLLERVAEHAERAPEQPAYTEVHACGAPGKRLTYGQLTSSAAALATTLRERCGPDAVVLLVCPNSCEYPVAFLGILAAGCCAFPVSPTATTAELRSAIDVAKPAAVIAPPTTLAALGSDVPLTVPLTDLPRTATPTSFKAAGSTHQPRLLLHSSGTTGRPKIVRRSGRSLDAVSRQMATAIGFTPDDAVLAMVPLCHSYGVEHGLLAPLYAGSSVRLCAGFDLHTATRELGEGNVTILPTVPSVCEMLAGLAPPGTRYPALRAAYAAGGPLPRSVYERLEAELGMKVSQLYGATEIGSVTYASATDEHFDPASVGRPMDGVEIRTDADGQVLVRARSMFSGYLGGDGSELRDGFFSTGDLGQLDAHGNLTLAGRLKLLIDVGGLKVNPLEVEEVLASHPQVGACVVVPIRQSETVSRIKAVVTPTDASTPPAPDDLRAFARERLATHKVPRVVEVRPSLPRSATGKVLRHLVEAS